MKNTSSPVRRISAVLLALLLVCSALSATAFAAGTDQSLTFAAAGRTARSAAEIYAQNVNSMVSVDVSAKVNMFGYDTISEGAGSGFVITPDGYILTNAHVVEGAETISVSTYSGEKYDAELIGYDTSNDVAVLKINAEDLTPVTFGDSDKAVIGEDVIAIGNPLGTLNFSLTKGVISGLDREISLSGNMRLRLIQTDCAINAGSSGGALFNMYGEVIGITNSKASGMDYGSVIESITFAIPVNTVVDIIEQIMTKGEISSPYIGISIADVDESLHAYGVPKGADVMEVAEDSPAKEAGLQKNDVITAADGETITGSSDLVKYVRTRSVGDKVEFTVFRQGETIKITVKIGETVKSALPETDKPAE